MRVDVGHALIIKTTLIIFGLASSVPLIIAGSAILLRVMERLPVLIWAGAALLGWVAGEIIVKDAAVGQWLGDEMVHRWHLWAAGAGAVLVVAVGWTIRRMRHHQTPIDASLAVEPPGSETFPHHEKARDGI
jgi:predicted tellurium resistance membrane protein TerC